MWENEGVQRARASHTGWFLAECRDSGIPGHVLIDRWERITAIGALGVMGVRYTATPDDEKGKPRTNAENAENGGNSESFPGVSVLVRGCIFNVDVTDGAALE